jgi:radical SAM-linked protein
VELTSPSIPEVPLARTPDGPPPPPAVQKLQLRYAKRGRLRFASHRDFQRALERALRRAGVPMAYSAGFTPHPRISYANAAPTGAASEAEYLEISLARRCDPEALRVALNAALPPGLDITAAVEARPGGLAERLQASVWQVELPGVPMPTPEVDPAGLTAAVAALLAAERVEVRRMTKAGQRVFDAREAILSCQIVGGGESSPSIGCAILRLVVRHLTPAVRPDDVLAALLAVADFAPPSPPLVTRLAQGPLEEDTASVADPLAAERDVIGA